jgi:hypothetical protein
VLSVLEMCYWHPALSRHTWEMQQLVAQYPSAELCPELIPMVELDMASAAASCAGTVLTIHCTVLVCTMHYTRYALTMNCTELAMDCTVLTIHCCAAFFAKRTEQVLAERAADDMEARVPKGGKGVEGAKEVVETARRGGTGGGTGGGGAHGSQRVQGVQGVQGVQRVQGVQEVGGLRVGYISGSMHNHPIGHLLGGVFQAHLLGNPSHNTTRTVPRLGARVQLHVYCVGMSCADHSEDANTQAMASTVLTTHCTHYTLYPLHTGNVLPPWDSLQEHEW